MPDWGACLGLTPRRYQSGETDRSGAITKMGDPAARVALFEAAHVIMTRVARWFPLKAWAMRVAARRGAKRADFVEEVAAVIGALRDMVRWSARGEPLRLAAAVALG